MTENGAPRGQTTGTRAGEEGHEDLHDAPRRQKPPLSQPELFSLDEEEPGGRRPPCLGEPPVPRHGFSAFVPVPILDLDAPVPQMVEQLVGVLKIFDNSLAEQVIEAPKIILQQGSAPCCSSFAAAGGTGGGSAGPLRS